jgi:hypothetical protein
VKRSADSSHTCLEVTVNAAELRAYLLGMLPEPAAVSLEERIVEDDDLFLTLRSLEDDLFDEYARGGLIGVERERFLEKYGSDGGRLAFAGALAARTSSNKRRVIPHYSWMALAAAAMLLLALSSILLRRPAQPPAPAATAQAQPPQAPFVVALTLAGSRAAGIRASIAVPAAAAVQLRVRIDPADRYERYTMQVRSAANTIVWGDDKLHAAVDGADTIVTGLVPGHALSAGTYELSVTGVNAGGAPADLGFITFEVTRTP